MTAQQLSYIVAVDRLHSFSQAADSCFVTQPTLSAQIHKLEEELGIELFDRSTKPVETTPIGRLVIDESRQVAASFERIEALILQEKTSLEGIVRIGIIPTLAPYILPIFLAQFCQAHPKLQLRIEELLSQAILDALAHDHIDIGLMAGPVNDKRMQETRLFDEPFVAYLSPDCPLMSHPKLNPKELDPSQMLLLAEGHCFRDQVLSLCKQAHNQARGQISFESGSLETLKKMVDSGFSYTLLPELACRILSETEKSRLRRFPDPQPSRQIVLVTHRGFVRSHLRESLTTAITETITPQLPAAGRYAVPWKKTGLE